MDSTSGGSLESCLGIMFSCGPSYGYQDACRAGHECHRDCALSHGDAVRRVPDLKPIRSFDETATSDFSSERACQERRPPLGSLSP